jgi:hypothetical protein
MLKKTNEMRFSHAELLMGSESAIGDWIRPYRRLRFRRAASTVVLDDFDLSDESPVSGGPGPWALAAGSL